MENIHKIRENIYITNDEEIKEGDWMIRGNEQPIKVTKDFFWDFGVRYYKIILTTDQDLIKDGVQAIDDEFLEWFIKNPNCKEVDINIDFGVGLDISINFYKIIIPKEELNQEKLLGKTISQKDADKDSFEDVTKYKKERMYSKEEVLNFTQTMLMQYKFGNTNIEQMDLLRETFQLFKNK